LPSLATDLCAHSVAAVANLDFLDTLDSFPCFVSTEVSFFATLLLPVAVAAAFAAYYQLGESLFSWHSVWLLFQPCSLNLTC
jgi:hypothetical protein